MQGELGKILKAETLIAGRRAYEVAAAASLSPGSLSDIFSGKVELTPGMVNRLRQAIWGSQIKRLVLEHQQATSGEKCADG
jgi:plasmid maintenance system antidote protein VapI